MADLSKEQLEYVLRFQHPEKTLAKLPGVSADTVAPLFAITRDAYTDIHDGYALRVAESARELLAERDVALRVEETAEADAFAGPGTAPDDMTVVVIRRLQAK